MGFAGVGPGLIDWPVCGSFVGSFGLVGAGCFAPIDPGYLIGRGRLIGWGLTPGRLVGPANIGAGCLKYGANMGRGGFGGGLARVIWFRPG